MDGLGFAIWSDDHAAVRSLLDSGVAVDVWGGEGDRTGVTPLMESVDELEGFFDADRVAVVELLIAHGADLHRHDQGGRTALHYAAAAGEVAVGLLIRAGADPDASSVLGRTPLHEAVDRGCMSSIVALCNASANVSLRDHEGHTPLDLVDEGFTSEERAILARLLAI